MIRWAYLFQTYCPAEIIITHCSGPKLGTADFLSRVWIVPKSKEQLHPKKAVHIKPTFTPGSVISYNDIIQALEEDQDIVKENIGQNVMIKTILTETSTQTPIWDCEKQDEKFIEKDICVAKISNNILSSMFLKEDKEINALKLSVDELQDQLSQNKFRQEQKGDVFCQEMYQKLDSQKSQNEKFYLYKDILYKNDVHNKKEHFGRRVVPKTLQPTVLALYHWRGHPGGNRLFSDILYIFGNICMKIA